MRQNRNTTLALLCLLLTGSGMTVAGGEVRVAFLDDELQREEALGFLSKRGFSQEGLGSLRKAMRSYYSEPFPTIFSNVQIRVNGTYTFRSGKELVATLPHKLCDTRHEYQINCFDTVLLLAEQDMSTDLRLYGQGRVLLAPWNSGRGSPLPVPSACAYDAFRWTYPEWYVTGTAHSAGMTWEEKRICLTVGLYCFKVLPWTTLEPDLKDAALAALRAHWTSQGLRFPNDYEIVLGHNLDMKRCLLLTEHAGLLFRGKDSSRYFEKSGGRGPFVMLDFKDDADLIAWFEATVSDGKKWGYAHHFMTFNDKRIEQLKPNTSSTNSVKRQF